MKVRTIFIKLLLLLLTLCPDQLNCDLEIDTIEGTEPPPETLRTTVRPKGQSRSLGGNITWTSRKFNCIVCDDIKEDNCQPWDKFSYSKNCYDDPRINKSLRIGCRKLVQQIGDRTFVGRHCTNLVDDSVQGCIDRVGTKKIKVKYCHCRDKENCNAGSGLVSNWRVALMLALVTVALLATVCSIH